jgi:hypothetical protein
MSIWSIFAATLSDVEIRMCPDKLSQLGVANGRVELRLDGAGNVCPQTARFSLGRRRGAT